MRNWLFHPVIFYPLAIALAVLVIAISVRPQSLERTPAPIAAAQDGASLLFTGTGFNSPAPSPGQNMTVTRDFWGAAKTLRIAVQPNQAAPTPADHGIQVLLTPEDAARINGQPTTVEIIYTPLPVNTAQGLAVSLQGAQPATWVSRAIPPQRSVIRFDLPAQTSPTALGLRAINQGDAPEAFGLEITSIRITPHAAAAPPN